MNFTTRDPNKFGAALREAARQLAFAQSSAINRTAKQIQAAQVAHAHQVFTIRRRSFMDRAYKIKPFATKRLPVAVIRVEPPGGPARADIITRHQFTGTRMPFQGRALLVPQAARTSPQRMVSKTQRPESFNFRRVATQGSWEVWEGERRAVMIRRPDGSGFVFRRGRRGRHGSFAGMKVLWTLETQTPIDGVLNFFENADRVFRATYATNFAAAYRKALETSRGYS